MARLSGRAGARVLGPWSLGVVLGALTAWPAVAGHGPDWTVLTIKAAYVKSLLDAGERVVLIDLRPPREYQKGHVPGARSLPLAELRSRYQDIPRAGLVVLYCACPREDLQSAYLFLRGQSLRNLAVMDEGFPAWVAKGYPLEP